MLFKVNNYATLQDALDGLCAHLTAQGVEQERIFDCKLVACELLGNVLKHGDGHADLQVELQDGYIALKVLSKTSFQLPKEITCSDLLAEHGRGLFLVQTLCEGKICMEEESILAKIKIKK